MATSEEYATWIVNNADKKGTPDFDTVVRAYQDSMQGASKPVPTTSQGYRQGSEAPSPLQGLFSSLQGPTFGFADEITGALSAPLRTLVNGESLKSNYQDMRDYVRGASDKNKADFPVLSEVTRGMASAPLMAIGGAPSVAKLPAGIMMRTARAAGTGGAFGGLSALGYSKAEDPEQIAMDTLIGAGTGAALSGAAVPITAGIGAIYGNIAPRVSESKAGQYAREKIAQAFTRDNPTEPISQVLARYRKLGPEARVADAGGQSTKSLLDLQATLPGTTKQAVETMIHDRQVGRPSRLIGAAESGLNPSGLRFQETVDDLIARRKEASAPLYDELYKSVVPSSEKLVGIVGRAEELGAAGTARKIATAEGVPYSLNPEAPTLPLRDLDRIKQGLDKLIGDNTDQFGRKNPYAVSVIKLKDELIKELDSATGQAYKAAREAFSGPSALIDATRTGRKFLAMDDQGVTKAMRGMTSGESEAFRLGAFEALRSKLGTESGQTQILKMWKEPATSERLKALFGNERAFREFASSVAVEARLKGLETVGRGSQTAARHYAAGDLDVSALGDVAGAARDASVGNVPGLLSRAGSLWNTVKTPEPVRNEIGNVLLSGGPTGAANITALERAMMQVNEARRREMMGLGLLGGQAGGLLGGAKWNER